MHSNQLAYQAAKSVKRALHQLVARVEKALDQQETALGVFLDTEGAFSNTCYGNIRDIFLSGMVVITRLCGGLGPPWRAAWLWRHSMDFL